MIRQWLASTSLNGDNLKTCHAPSRPQPHSSKQPPVLFGPGALKKSSGAGGAPELVELVYAIFPAASNLELGGTTFFWMGLWVHFFIWVYTPSGKQT